MVTFVKPRQSVCGRIFDFLEVARIFIFNFAFLHTNEGEQSD